MQGAYVPKQPWTEESEVAQTFHFKMRRLAHTEQEGCMREELPLMHLGEDAASGNAPGQVEGHNGRHEPNREDERLLSEEVLRNM